MKDELVSIGVGQPYPFPYERGIDQTRCQFFTDGQCSLLIGLPDITRGEIECFRGDLYVGFIELEYGMLITFKFEREGLEDIILACPYNPALIPDEHWLEDHSDDSVKFGHRLAIIIVFDTVNGLIDVIRSFTMNPTQHKALLEVASDQRIKAELLGKETWVMKNYVEMNNVMARHTNEELWEKSVSVYQAGSEG